MLFPIVATAQDDDTLLEERVAVLEAQVEAQATIIADLEARIASLEATPVPGDEEPAPSNGGVESLQFSGSGGPEVTEVMDLSGAYFVSSSCRGGSYFNVDTTNVDSQDDRVRFDIFASTPFDGEEVATFDPARYIFSVNCQGPWSLAIRPIE